MANATSVTIKPFRGFSTFTADAVIEERHEDELVITEHPVEAGATIADHAYKLPAEVTLTYVWGLGSPQNRTQDATFLQTLYQQLLQLQVNRTIFQVFTGKRIYSNMLLQALRVDTDRSTENALRVVATCREVLIATTQIVQTSSAVNQAFPQNNGPTVNMGPKALQPAPNFNTTVAPPGGF